MCTYDVLTLCSVLEISSRTLPTLLRHEYYPARTHTHTHLRARARQLEKLTPEEMMELEGVEPEESKLSWDFE